MLGNTYTELIRDPNTIVVDASKPLEDVKI